LGRVTEIVPRQESSQFSFTSYRTETNPPITGCDIAYKKKRRDKIDDLSKVFDRAFRESNGQVQSRPRNGI